MKYIQYGTEFLDQLKDKVHEQQWEIEELKEELKREQDNSIYLEERINKAIEELEIWQPKEKILQEEKEYILDILKGVELTENDKKQVKWLKEEFKVGADNK